MNNKVPGYNTASLDDYFSSFQQALKDYLNLNIFTASIMEIVEVNDNKVNLKPVIKKKDSNGDLIEITNNDIVYNIPVMMLFGGLSQISFKVAIGDKGLLIACKDDYSNYIDTQIESEIGSNRKFSLSNGFYLPLNFNSVEDAVIIKNGNSKIEITDGIIDITNGISNININSDVINITNGTSSININSNEINTTNSDGELNIGSDNLIQIKNTAQSLFTVLNTLLTTLINLKTGTTPETATFVIDTATSASLTTLQTNLALLLKA